MRVPNKRLALLAGLFLLVTSFCNAQQLLVQPYLQHAMPAMMVVMWETDILDSSFVEWG